MISTQLCACAWKNRLIAQEHLLEGFRLWHAAYAPLARFISLMPKPRNSISGMCVWKVPFDRKAKALTNHLDPLRCLVNTTKRFVGSGPLVKLSVHALCAALSLWTSRDAAAATAAHESARTRRMAM